MPTTKARRITLFPGDSEMARRMGELDWRATALGPTYGWPHSLRTAVRILLTSRYAMWMGWGPDLAFLYNDAYKPTLGVKHPAALGWPAQQVWSEIWHDISPRIQTVMKTGTATWDEGLLLVLERSGYPEETYHTFSYSPLTEEDGTVSGMLCVVTEATVRVIGERRLASLQELSSALASTTTEMDALAAIKRVLAASSKDLPFTLTYLFKGGGISAELAARTGIPLDHPAAPRLIEMGANHPVWPGDALRHGNAPIVVDNLAARFDELPRGVWEKPPRQALLVPIAQQGQTQPAGFIVAGLNPFRKLDEAYTGFIQLIAGQVAASLANARAAEEERKRAEALAEIDRAKTVFFSNVSHEFRTPLTLMLSPLEDSLGDAREPLQASQRHRLKVVQRNSLRLLKLVNTLLDFSRIESGRIQASYEPLDLGVLTADIASNFRAACERAGLTLVIACRPFQSAMGEAAYVDRDMWEKIVLNLLSNAFKFTLKGTIVVSLVAEDGYAKLLVTDTGTGIPAKELPHLFERFYRVEGAQGRTGEGSGIGLSLVEDLVKLHGGTVRATSSPGHGSTFSVSIPLGRAHLPQDRIGAAREPGVSTTRAAAFVEEVVRWLPGEADVSGDPGEALDSAALVQSLHGARDGSRLRIVWVDDNADMREYVCRLLAPVYEVHAVADGEAALSAALSEQPDLVLTDVMMPHMGGFELLRQLRSDPRTRDVPVIILSARAGEESRLEGLETGADDYVIKPFSARELLARVAAHLELARVRRAALVREKELHEELINVLESMTDGFVALDRESRITYVNAAAERTNGTTRDRLLGRIFWEAFPHVLGTDFERALRRAMAGRVPVRGETFYPRYGRWFELDIHPIENGGLAFYSRDITERKQTEEALRGSEERFRRLFELGPLGRVLTSPTKGCLVVNDAFCSIVGYDRAELLQMNWPELTHPDDLAADIEQFNRVMAGEIDGYSMDKRWIRKDGSVVDTTLWVNCVRRSDGAVDYFVALVQEITERKRAEEALRRSEERYRSLISQVRDFAIFSTDELGVVTTWNEGCQYVLGYGPEEFVGLDSAELCTPEDDVEGVPAAERRQAIQGGTGIIDRWLRAKGGRRFFAMGATAPLRDSAGRVIGFSWVVRDVTPMKKFQDQLAQRGESLERLVSERTGELEETTERLRVSERMAALGTLAAGLGHDMGNLLLPMDVRLSLLIEADLPRELHEHVVGIQKCARYLQRLSSGLRLLATDPEHVESRGATDLGRWWNDVRIILKDVLPGGIRFEHHLPDSESWVALGRTGLTQIVYNLVQNAADAIKQHGGTRVSVSVENDPPVPWITIRVADDGPGMTDEVARRCMEPYFSTKSRGESTGMGLSLVHALVTDAGGQIEIKSAAGQGTTISLILPRALPRENIQDADMVGAV